MATAVDYEVEVEDVEYRRLDGTPWLARIYRPKGGTPTATLVDVHGGAWVNGDRKNNEAVDRLLAARGMLIAALDFRQPPEGGYPDGVADINLGIRWLKANASKFGGSSRVGAIGNSSGGHLVALCGIRPRDPRYAALPLEGHPDVDASLAYVVACWPVIDPLYRFNVARENGWQHLVEAHLSYWGSEEAMAEGAPRNALEKGEAVDMPPMLLALKPNDKNHPQPMQDAFVEAYRKRGGSIEVAMLEGLPERGFSADGSDPANARARDVVEEFIRKHA
ncbi:MAG TPA: alpha/beta hydrolase [Chloroflexota bacterium]|nr:alpha/beta hydrolase [Chloroflexota bacterium]